MNQNLKLKHILCKLVIATKTYDFCTDFNLTMELQQYLIFR